MNATPPLLSINSLTISFAMPSGVIHAIDAIDLTIEKGKTLALVGESGSGKSLTALSIMRLIPRPGFIESGSILLEGRDLLTLTDDEMRGIRGSRISMVFQEPMTSLNPVLRIGDQIIEPLKLHRGMSKEAGVMECCRLLKQVGIPSPEERMRDYPHQLSGGMRQRVMIAMALACSPSLMIADEPTTALDVTIQAQILELIDTLRRSTDMGILLITHDLGIVAERSDHTSVMYAGRIVESAPTDMLFDTPRHPYTRALINSLPRYATPGRPLAALPGQTPDLAERQPGCSFCTRCPVEMPVCAGRPPEAVEVAPDHIVRCWNYS